MSEYEKFKAKHPKELRIADLELELDALKFEFKNIESELTEARRELDEERGRKVWCLEERPKIAKSEVLGPRDLLVWRWEKDDWGYEVSTMSVAIIDGNINAAIDRARGKVVE